MSNRRVVAAVLALTTSSASFPADARFMQVDPVGYQDQVNLYAYVSNDPLNKVDPTGRDGIVIVQQNGNINIIIPTTFSGDAAMPGNISAYINNVQSTFTGNFDGYNVTTTVVNGSSPIDPSVKNTMVLTNGNTSPAPDGRGRGGHSYVLDGTKGQITMKDVRGIGIPLPGGRLVGTADKGGPNVFSHEGGGHILGLPDTNQSGPSIMDAGPGNRVTGRDIETILNNGAVGGGRPTVTNTIVRCGEDPKQAGCR